MAVRNPLRARTRSGATASGSAWVVREIVQQPVGALNPYVHNARQHSDAQIELVANSIRTFGFTNPILVDGLQRYLGIELEDALATARPSPNTTCSSPCRSSSNVRLSCT